MSRWARPITLALLLVAAAGVLPAAATALDRRLPPPRQKDLARIFDPKLRDLGLRTSRARLQNRNTYDIDPHGRHLAVYVEPTGDAFTDAEYVDAYTKVAKVFLPMVFKRWRGLESFDVCLEPLASEDPSKEPPPVTQLVVSRSGASEVSWSRATLADLIAAANAHLVPGKSALDFAVYFRERLDTQPELVEARSTAESR